MQYRIWCEVSGGVTGHRYAWLKKDGKEAVFESVEEATAEAERLTERTNGNPYRKANFRYTVKRVRDENSALESYWSESATASVEDDYRSGNFTTVGLSQEDTEAIAVEQADKFLRRSRKT